MQPGTLGQSSSPQPPLSAVSAEGAAKIQHTRTGIGAGAHAAPAASAEHAAESAPSVLSPTAQKITTFGRDRRHEENWTRTPNTTGAGAIHVRTFSCKLTEDALAYMDQAINEWLDAHPQYEVKFVSSSIGVMTGKLKEPAMICQVWV